MPDPALIARLHSIYSQATRLQREVVGAALGRLSVHPKQHAGQLLYTEMCPNYLLTMEGVTGERDTAYRAWRLLRSAVGWWTATKTKVAEMGVTVRRLGSGERHGQHLLLTEAQVEGIRHVAETLGLIAQTDDQHLSWEPISPRMRGNTLVACCPFHPDTHPSMLLDPRRQRATCLSCATTHRFDPGGSRVSSPTGQVAASASPLPSPALRSIEYTEPPGAEGWWLVGSLAKGVRTQGVPGDLLSVLAWADANGDRVMRPMAGCRPDPWSNHPDQLVALDDMRGNGRWKQVRAKWVPQSHEPVAIRFLCVDFDACDYAPFGDETQPRQAAAAIQGWVNKHPAFTGRMSMLRTSLLGVQVVVELAAARAPAWKAGVESHQLHDALDGAVRAALWANGWGGGHPDPTARLTGRWIRRPGFRVSRKTRQPWVARLTYINQEQADGDQKEDAEAEGSGSSCGDPWAGRLAS